MTKHYDFILAGGGLAGLSLACHLVNSPLRDSPILSVDPDTKERNDRTWSYWTRQPGLFDGAATQTLLMKLRRMTSSPIAMPSGVKFASLSVSGHACGVSVAGEVWCWGLGAYGELGDGMSLSRPSPVKVAGITSSPQSISAGSTTTHWAKICCV